MRKICSILPLCVSLTLAAQTSDYPATCNPDGEVGGHEYVDLGLPSGTLWATCNLGASSPYRDGDYFAWGETIPRDMFKWTDYKFFEQETTNADGTQSYDATDIGDRISGTEYDAARSLWGEGWRMPEIEDWEELQTYCHVEFRTESYIDMEGALRIWGPNGKSIFLPLTFSPHSGVSTDVLRGEYWTATIASDDTDYIYPAAIQLYYNPADPKLEFMPNCRHDGLSIRPVISRTEMATPALPDSDFRAYGGKGRITIINHTEAEVDIFSIGGEKAACVSDPGLSHVQLPAGIYIVASPFASRKVAVN